MSSHPSNKVTAENVEAVFTYHAPVPPQVESYQKIRNAAKELVGVILQNCPDCADRSAAIREVRVAVMTANAAIALSGAE